MEVQRTETHLIKEGSSFYRWAMSECERSKNLYNRALYIYRQAFTGQHQNIEDYKMIIQKGKFVNGFGVSKRMITLKDNDYYSMTKKNSATQVIFQVDRVMKSWFAALKSYKKNPSRFNGRPRMPRYKKKNELNCLTYTYMDAKLQKDGTINIRRDIKIPIHTDIEKFQQVRIIPKQGCI